MYGDMERVEDAASVREAVGELIRAAQGAAGPSLHRHSLAVEAMIRAAELVQALLDAEREERGCDARSLRGDAGVELVCTLAGLVGASWEGGFQVEIAFRTVSRLLERLDLSGAVRLRQAEGFAIYALYPETYWEAARVSGLGADTRVIGIRSIGLALGAIVKAALEAPGLATLRPTGHPFDRQVDVSPSLKSELLANGGGSFAVVDEGPGLSGSSFAAVAGFLRAGGVPAGAVTFFPSHGNGPGSQAAVEARTRWAQSPHVWRSFEATILHAAKPSHRLDRWVADLVGPLAGPLEDLGGGRWRAHAGGGSDLPCEPNRERRKFLARTEAGNFLVKFAGLGQAGRRKLETARRLHDAGFCAEPIGLCHGMLVERWIERSSAPLPARGGMVARIGTYLGFRSRHLAPVNRGAGLSRLREMAVFNFGRALGDQAAAACASFLARAGAWSGSARPVDTDNRLHRWEWLLDGTGALRKTDALDHSSDHDLVGCQDIAWDVAGAIVEFGLAGAEVEALGYQVSAAAGRRVEPGLVSLLLPCYLGFQLGRWNMARDAAPADCLAPVERELFRYGDAARSWLAAPQPEAWQAQAKTDQPASVLGGLRRDAPC